VEIETAEPMVFDSYRENRATGGFILIDPITNLTMAAGLIEQAAREERRRKTGIEFQALAITPAERASLYGHRAARVALAGREEIAPLAERALLEQGAHVFLRDRDDVAVDALTDAGLIVLDTRPGAEGGIDTQDLSADADEAVLELMERLRRAGVFLDHDAVQPGEGI
jgi:bifunctional enzyme CysN/CysC